MSDESQQCMALYCIVPIDWPVSVLTLTGTCNAADWSLFECGLKGMSDEAEEECGRRMRRG